MSCSYPVHSWFSDSLLHESICYCEHDWIPWKQLDLWQIFLLTMNTSQHNITRFWGERCWFCIEILCFQHPIFSRYIDGCPLQLLYIYTLGEINIIGNLSSQLEKAVGSNTTKTQNKWKQLLVQEKWNQVLS